MWRYFVSVECLLLYVAFVVHSSGVSFAVFYPHPRAKFAQQRFEVFCNTGSRVGRFFRLSYVWHYGRSSARKVGCAFVLFCQGYGCFLLVNIMHR